MRKFKSEAIITFDPVQQVEFNRQTSEAINVLMSKYNAGNRLKTLIFMGAFAFLGTYIYSTCKAIKDYSVEGKDFGITKTGKVFDIALANDNAPNDFVFIFHKKKSSNLSDADVLKATINSIYGFTDTDNQHSSDNVQEKDDEDVGR